MTIIKIYKGFQSVFFEHIFNAIFCLIGLRLKTSLIAFYGKKKWGDCGTALLKNEIPCISYYHSTISWKCSNILLWPKYVCLTLGYSLWVYILYFVINIFVCFIFLFIDIPICVMCIITCGMWKDPLRSFKENHIITLILYIIFVIKVCFGIPDFDMATIITDHAKSLISTAVKQIVTTTIGAGGTSPQKLDVYYCMNKDIIKKYDKYYVHRIHGLRMLCFNQYMDQNSYADHYPPLAQIPLGDYYELSLNQLFDKLNEEKII
jgi:hypothetical protein